MEHRLSILDLSVLINNFILMKIKRKDNHMMNGFLEEITLSDKASLCTLLVHVPFKVLYFLCILVYKEYLCYVEYSVIS